jgi:hypothetical protein
VGFKESGCGVGGEREVGTMWSEAGLESRKRGPD